MFYRWVFILFYFIYLIFKCKTWIYSTGNFWWDYFCCFTTERLHWKSGSSLVKSLKSFVFLSNFRHFCLHFSLFTSYLTYLTSFNTNLATFHGISGHRFIAQIALKSRPIAGGKRFTQSFPNQFHARFHNTAA